MPPKFQKKQKMKKERKELNVGINGMTLTQMSRESLESYVIQIQRELEREREERNYFQLEKDKLWNFWKLSQELADKKNKELLLLEQKLEVQDIQHQKELNTYNQKIKHLMYEHKTFLGETLEETHSRMAAQDDQFHTYEKELKDNIDELHLQLEETILSHQDHIRELQKEQAKQLHENHEKCEHQQAELKQRWEQKLSDVTEKLDIQRRTEIHQLEERKNEQIQILTCNHDRSFSQIKAYYNDIIASNLALISSLKEQNESLKKQSDCLEKDLQHLQKENKQLQDPLQKAQKEILELKHSLTNYERDKASLKSIRLQLKQQTNDIQQEKWEKEILTQRFKLLENERDTIYDKFLQAINNMQQRSNLKAVLLEKQLNKVNEDLQIKDIQLKQILTSGQFDPTHLEEIKNQFQEQIEVKNSAISELKLQLAEACTAHNHLLCIFKAQLEAHKIPLADFGIKPLQFIDNHL